MNLEGSGSTTGFFNAHFDVLAWVKNTAREKRTSLTKVAKAVGVRVTELVSRIDDESEKALREDVVRELS